MNKVTTKALILKGSNYGESDRIVTFLSKELGKVSGIAKAGRKSLKRFGGSLEPFTLVEIVMKPRDGLSLLLESSSVKDFRQIKSDVDKIFYGSYMLELSESMIDEGEPDAQGRLFNLLLSSMEALDACGNPEEVVRQFEISILNLTGYMPSLLKCISCGKEVRHQMTGGGSGEAGRLPFSISKGGVFCPACSRASEDSLDYVSYGTLRTLDAATSGKVAFTKHALEESGRIIPAFIVHHLGKRLKCLEFIEKMKEL